MQIITIVSGALYNNSYILINNNQAIMVDASPNVKTIKKYIGNIPLKAVLITHGHFDHIFNLQEIIEHYQCKCYMHPNAYFKLDNSLLNCSHFASPVVCKLDKSQCEFVKNNQTINLIGLDIKAIYTPGHTDCCVSYLIGRDMFVGDTLFYDGYGRTDLPTSSEQDMMSSLKLLKSNYKNYHFYPGHGQNGII